MTLRQLGDLIQDVAAEARLPGVVLDFKVCYPDKTGKNVISPMGQVVPSDRKRGKYDHKTLKEVKFHIGDYLVMNIRTPDGRGRDRVRDRDVSME